MNSRCEKRSESVCAQYGRECSFGLDLADLKGLVRFFVHESESFETCLAVRRVRARRIAIDLSLRISVYAQVYVRVMVDVCIAS